MLTVPEASPAVALPAASSRGFSAPSPEGFLDLFRLWRNEQSEPETFYRAIAWRAVDDLANWFGPLAGQKVADLGCGPGWYTHALREVGATVIPVDNDAEQLAASGLVPSGAIVGDAMDLPFDDRELDGVFTSNMLEHVPDSRRVIREVARVLKPGGWAYVSWTNWFSPWGGHDMTPFHLLGPKTGMYLHRKVRDTKPKVVYGESLWPVHIGSTLRYVRAQPGLQVVSVEPRYWPRLRFIVDIPVMREFLTWNCVIRIHKHG